MWRASTIAVGRAGGTVVVTLRGTLDTLGATRLAATLRDLIEGQGNLALALDLQGLEEVAPAGLQVLTVAAAGLERRGGSFWLCEPNRRVCGALGRARLSRFVGDPRRDGSTTSGRGCAREAPLAWGANAGARAKHPAGTGRKGDARGANR